MGKHATNGHRTRDDSKKDLSASNSKKAPKKAASKPSLPKPVAAPKTPSAQQLIPLDLQQLLLNIFKDSFPTTIQSDTLTPLLQEVKAALYTRDFEKAFGKREWLEAYAVRWSPSRALGYGEVLAGLKEELEGLLSGGGEEKEGRWRGKVVCFGGGAAEIVALCGFVRFLLGEGSMLRRPVEKAPASLEEMAQKLQDASIMEGPASDAATAEATATEHPAPVKLDGTAAAITEGTAPEHSSPVKLDVTLVDSAAWGALTSTLHSGILSPPPVSKYAKVSSLALIPSDSLKHEFVEADVLSMSSSSLKSMIGEKPCLLTLLFTLNELYTSSIAKTTAFLLNLTEIAVKDTLLLVVDSPGSYSEAAVGKGEEGKERKKYPMAWLMDHALLKGMGLQGKETGKWEKVKEEESRWFRLGDKLKYPVKLEDMRFQLHLYRRL